MLVRTLQWWSIFNHWTIPQRDKSIAFHSLGVLLSMKWEVRAENVFHQMQPTVCLFMLTCTAALHCTHTQTHTHKMTWGTTEFSTWVSALSLNSPCANHKCLTQKKTHHCTKAFAACEPVGPSRESTTFCWLCSDADLCGDGIQTQLDRPLSIWLMLLSCCVSGELLMAVAWELLV